MRFWSCSFFRRLPLLPAWISTVLRQLSQCWMRKLAPNIWHHHGLILLTLNSLLLRNLISRSVSFSFHDLRRQVTLLCHCIHLQWLWHHIRSFSQSHSDVIVETWIFSADRLVLLLLLLAWFICIDIGKMSMHCQMLIMVVRVFGSWN